MSLYKSPDDYIARRIEGLGERERRSKRLEIDLADLLTGPTSRSRAEDLARSMLATATPNEIAAALREIADRIDAS